MKALINTVLTELLSDKRSRLPQSKTVTRTRSVLEETPYTLAKFMDDNGIPKEAWFEGDSPDYFEQSYSDFVLCWEVEIPTTDADKLNYLERVFNSNAFTRVAKALLADGYKRISPDHQTLKQYRGMSHYSLFTEGNMDTIVDYIKLHFTK